VALLVCSNIPTSSIFTLNGEIGFADR
jgi:hypothetical protein